MKVSIIIPAYNAEKYIEKCINSIGNNSDVEIIVINDGSSDCTYNKVSGYKNVVLINNDNHGVSYSRNCGISKANGEYILFVDADDYLTDNWSEVILNEKFTEDVVYINSRLRVNDKKELLNYIIGKYAPCIAGPYCKLYNRKFLLENKILFKEDLINGEDMLFNFECAQKLRTFKIINDSIYCYRINNFGVTKKYNNKILESDKKFHEYMEQLLEEFDKGAKYDICIFNIENAIFTLFDRIAYIKEYKNYKLVVKQLYIKPYTMMYDKKYKAKSFKKRITIEMFKKKLYLALYLTFNFLHKINRIKNSTNSKFIRM